jgi:hypothetical protein
MLVGAFSGQNWANGLGGDDDDVTFFTAADAPPGAATYGDVKRVELTVVTLASTGERALARRVVSNLLSPTPVDPDNEILARGVRSFNLRYYDGAQWWNSWDSTLENDSLPAAVEVTLELDSPEGRLDADAPRGPRLMRFVQLPCTGEADPSERREPELDTEGEDGGDGARGPQASAAGAFGAPPGGSSTIMGDHR